VKPSDATLVAAARGGDRDAFAAAVLAAAGARLREVRVSRLAEDTFYAVAVVDGPAGPREVDARPSDALNLALAAGAPVRVASDVLERVAAAATPEACGAWEGEGTAGAGDLVAERLRDAAARRPPP
jgi:hypothetical protein